MTATSSLNDKTHTYWRLQTNLVRNPMMMSGSAPQPIPPFTSTLSKASNPPPILHKPSDHQPPKLQSTTQEPAWNQRRVVGTVDYDRGKRRVSVEVPGLGRDHIPGRYRVRVDGSRWQVDWKVSEVVDKVLELKHWEDIEGLLNRWVGRFARKNFPLLIKVCLRLSSFFACSLLLSFFFSSLLKIAGLARSRKPGNALIVLDDWIIALIRFFWKSILWTT